MLHPTRLSLSASGATPQAAQPPGMRKKRLERTKWPQHHAAAALWSLARAKGYSLFIRRRSRGTRAIEMSLLQSPPHTYAAFLCFMGVLTATVSGYLASMMASSSSCCRNCKHPATGVGHSPRRSTRRRGG
jgi:hypothetical protein